MDMRADSLISHNSALQSPVLSRNQCDKGLVAFLGAAS
jgi:hypothetical protein